MTREKAKITAKNAAKGISSSFLGSLQALWKYGGKWLVLANIFSFICITGVYNWFMPEYTVVGYYQTAFQVGGELSTMVGMGIVSLLLIGAIGYMANNTKRSLGWVGLIFMGSLIGLIGFWMFTLGTFSEASTMFIATISQFGISFILAFGLVYAKIDKLVTGRINTDSYDVTDDE